MRSLDPDHASAHRAQIAAWFGVRYFEGHPHVPQTVVLGLIEAAVAINDQGGGAFLEGAAQSVHADYRYWHSLDNARGPALLNFGTLLNSGFRHTIPQVDVVADSTT